VCIVCADKIIPGNTEDKDLTEFLKSVTKDTKVQFSSDSITFSPTVRTCLSAVTGKAAVLESSIATIVEEL
jgi:hypothetical protein